MSAMTDVLEDLIRAHIFRTATFAKPTQLWIGLFTAAPSDAGGGTEVSTSGTGYARVQRDPSDANWTAASPTDGLTDNAAAITFGVPLAAWGNVTHFGIFTLSAGGSLWIWGALAAPKNVNLGDPAPTFPIGTLDVTFG